MGHLQITELTRPALEEGLRWIHRNMAELEFCGLRDDAFAKLQLNRDSKSTFCHVAYNGRQLVAASYLKFLSGNVVTLGGVRALAGFESVAARMIANQTSQLRQNRIRQIQAVVQVADEATAKIIELAGFEHLTSVQHMWLDLRNPNHEHSQNALELGNPSLSWKPATTLASSRMAQLIEATFRDTLDCPQLNGLRDRAEVLQGFLDGRQFRCAKPWELLSIDGKVVGCVLLTAHPQQVAELAYMGLIPAARGKKLGRAMLRRAIELSKSINAINLVAAVDESNWPALQVYQEFGFQVHQRFTVWLLR